MRLSSPDPDKVILSVWIIIEPIVSTLDLFFHPHKKPLSNH